MFFIIYCLGGQFHVVYEIAVWHIFKLCGAKIGKTPMIYCTSGIGWRYFSEKIMCLARIKENGSSGRMSVKMHSATVNIGLDISVTSSVPAATEPAERGRAQKLTVRDGKNLGAICFAKSVP